MFRPYKRHSYVERDTSRLFRQSPEDHLPETSDSLDLI